MESVLCCGIKVKLQILVFQNCFVNVAVIGITYDCGQLVGGMPQFNWIDST